MMTEGEKQFNLWGGSVVCGSFRLDETQEHIKLKIRPRLKIGAGGQMTFLEGRREDIERSYRRAMGITEDDDMKAMKALLCGAYGIRNASKVELGADLNEWKITGDKKHGESFQSGSWFKAHHKHTGKN
jgi:hypothetical protein